MTFADRKRIELAAKLASLSQELADWVNASKPGEPLEKHHTQIRRLETSLRAAIKGVAPLLDERVDVLSTWTTTEEQILAIHEVWDQFRTKLAHRYVPILQPHLDLADDLAWECYRPAIECAIKAKDGPTKVDEASVREPPLVFFTSSATPFTMVRGSTDAMAEPTVLSDAQRADVLRRLPVPLIGIPWFQLEHLPDVLVVAHEVGHDVEADLGLHDRILELIAGVPGVDSARWAPWASEVFADVWGAVAAGAGFASALLDLIATPPIVASPTASRYPDPWLRAALVCAVVDHVTSDGGSSGTRGADLLTRWVDEQGPLPSPSDVEDAGNVARTLVDGPYAQLGGTGLVAVLAPQMLNEADIDMGNLCLRIAPQGKSVRVLVAAAALAFADDPWKYTTAGYATTVRRSVAENRAKGTRSQLSYEHDPGDPLTRFVPHDEAVGLAILRHVGEATSLA